MKKLFIALFSLMFISCASMQSYQPNHTIMMQGQVALELFKDRFFFDLNKYYPDIDPWGIPDTTLDWNLVYAWPTSVVHIPKTDKVSHYRLIYSAIVYARYKWQLESKPPLLIGMIFPKEGYGKNPMMCIRYRDPNTISLPVDGWLFYEYRESDITKTYEDLDKNYQFELFQVSKPDQRYYKYIDFRMGVD
jgi:hypothetical protein